MTPHAALILVHAIAATLALLAGLVTFARPGWVGLHAAGVLVMTASLLGAVALGWGSAPPAGNAIFVGLSAIALVMAVQAVLAWRRRPMPGHAASAFCLAAVGFSCIGLVTGFVAVSLTRLTTQPAALIGVPAITVVLGRVVLSRALRVVPAGDPQLMTGRSRS